MLQHKIGVTGGDVKRRFGNAKNEPTFLLADVKVVTTYNFVDINRVKVEKLIHKFFEPAWLKVNLADRFGKVINPREWFLVPLPVIDEAVELLQKGSIVNYRYEPEEAKIVLG